MSDTQSKVFRRSCFLALTAAFVAVSGVQAAASHDLEGRVQTSSHTAVLAQAEQATSHGIPSVTKGANIQQTQKAGEQEDSSRKTLNFIGAFVFGALIAGVAVNGLGEQKAHFPRPGKR